MFIFSAQNFYTGNLNMSSDLTPQDIARIVEDNIREYCANTSANSYINCLLEHPPEALPFFLHVSEYYGNDERIGRIIENHLNFLETLEDEYKKRWMSDFAKAIADGLRDQIQWVYESIIDDDSINNEEKANRLRELNNALDQLGKAILNALKSQKPLSFDELRKYADDITKNAGMSYVDNFDYYLDYYEHSLLSSAKLKTLDTLLNSIGNIMYDIDRKIKEYNSQLLTY